MLSRRLLYHKMQTKCLVDVYCIIKCRLNACFCIYGAIKAKINAFSLFYGAILVQILFILAFLLKKNVKNRHKNAFLDTKTYAVIPKCRAEKKRLPCQVRQ